MTEYIVNVNLYLDNNLGYRMFLELVVVDYWLLKLSLIRWVSWCHSAVQ